MMETLEEIRTPAPDSGDWQEPIILTEMLGDMEPDRLVALLDSCHDNFADWLNAHLEPGDVDLGPLTEEEKFDKGIRA